MRALRLSIGRSRFRGLLLSTASLAIAFSIWQLLSTFIFKYLHHEPVDFTISEPMLKEVRGPLASANIALPWLIFIKHSRWRDRLRSNFDFDQRAFQPFSSISYMATGGISHRLPLPASFYKLLFRVDMSLSRFLPKLFASFFIITLTRK